MEVIQSNTADPALLDAYREVARAVRVARVADDQPEFWREYKRGCAANHESIYLAAWCLLRAIELQVTPSSGMVDRLRAALNEKDMLDTALSAAVNHGEVPA